jgi:hypothetical protein
MPKVVLDVSSGVEKRDASSSSAATECNACAPSTICSVKAPGRALEHYATGRRQQLPPGLWILILHTRAPLTAQGRPQDCHSALTVSSGELTEMRW